jgi:protein ImuB
VRQLFVTFYCPELRPITFELKVSRPTRSVRHLRSMLTATLDNLQLPTGATGVTLWARRVEPLDAWQDELFDTGRADQEGLADLIDRLSSHLGPTAVVRPHPLSDHQPERTFEYVPLVDYGLANAEAESEKLEVRSEKRVLPEGIVTGTVLTSNFSLRSSPFSLLTSHFPSRPLRLLPKPVEVPVIAVVPEGPPSCFDWKGAREEITDCVGPERLETGWWRGQHVRRDYFRVTCRSGRGCWLFRQCETSRWFLHGWFD